MRRLTPQKLLIFFSLGTGAVSILVIVLIQQFSKPFYGVGSIAAGILIGLLSYCLGYFIIGRYLKNHMNAVFGNLEKARGQGEEPVKAQLDHDIFYRLNHELMNWSEQTQGQIQELKNAENYRREFVGNVSHELKTPIFNIQGYVHTLLEGGMEDTNINRKYLEKAVKNIERLSAIVEDLEAISQLETGELKLSFEKFDIRRLANDVIESQEITANERQISLQLEPSDDNRIFAKGDIGRIRQVLTNLMSNSIKYGHEGGYTAIRLHDYHDHVSVEVADNGIGISEEHLPRLFERFYRVDKSRSREQGGTGLGLSIVKHILEAHGKNIQVASEVGEGTVFYFQLDKP